MYWCHQNKIVGEEVPESEHDYKQFRMKKVVGSSLYCERWVSNQKKKLKQKNYLTVFSLN